MDKATLERIGDAYDGPNGRLGTATRLTLPRWNTIIAFDGPLGRRMRRVYVRESIALYMGRPARVTVSRKP